MGKVIDPKRESRWIAKVKPPHRCDPPGLSLADSFDVGPGSVWECFCGDRHKLVTGSRGMEWKRQRWVRRRVQADE